MELVRLSPAELPYFKRVYYDAFPKSEQKPMRFLLHAGKKNKLDLFLLRDRDENLGLTVTVPYGDLVLVYYLAVDPEKRGQGVGSQVMDLWQTQYPGKRIFLEIERPEEGAENQAQRLRRKAFYLRNGFRETGLTVSVFGVPMEVLSLNGPVTFREYHCVYRHILFPLCWRVRLISQEEVE